MPTGRNKVPMAALRSALEAAGLEDVQTYIQSGNVIASSALTRRALEALVHELIAEQFGGDIVVLAREAAYFRRALARSPFADEDPASCISPCWTNARVRMPQRPFWRPVTCPTEWQYGTIWLTFTTLRATVS